LNYETLLECAFQLVELGQAPDGHPQYHFDPRALFPTAFDLPVLGFQSKPTARLLKPRGSINWFYSGRSDRRYWGIFNRRLWGI